MERAADRVIVDPRISKTGGSLPGSGGNERGLGRPEHLLREGGGNPHRAEIGWAETAGGGRRKRILHARTGEWYPPSTLDHASRRVIKCRRRTDPARRETRICVDSPVFPYTLDCSREL